MILSTGTERQHLLDVVLHAQTLVLATGTESECEFTCQNVNFTDED